jgi:hypothetical protein
MSALRTFFLTLAEVECFSNILSENKKGCNNNNCHNLSDKSDYIKCIINKPVI